MRIYMVTRLPMRQHIFRVWISPFLISNLFFTLFFLEHASAIAFKCSEIFSPQSVASASLPAAAPRTIVEDRQNKDKEARRLKDQVKQMEKSLFDGTRAVMHRIDPGSFKMGEIGDQVDVTLTKPFEMMATPMTQIIWRTIADLAAKKLGRGRYISFWKPKVSAWRIWLV